jgi:Ca-activated chloride channel homolog
MRFADPVYFLLLVPALVLFALYVTNRIGREAVLRFSSVELVKRSGGRKLSFGRLFIGLLRLACLVLVIAALARPQTGTGEDKTTQQVIDIMLSLDVSGSMATLDFHPDNRLVAAKQEAKRFVEGRRDDRIGLVIFAGQSVTQCPLTVDHKAVLSLIDQIQLGTMQDGTAIGLGLASAVNRLKDTEAKSKVIILLTDGVNNTGEIDPVTAAGLAKQLGIKVYTIGVGKEGVALLPVQDPAFGQRLLKVETQIDEKVLDRIARDTGGLYFRAQDERALRSIFQQIDRLEKTEVKVERFTHYEEQYFWFLWPALFVLLFELAWTNLLFVKIP